MALDLYNGGAHTIYIYANGSSPVSLQLVITCTVAKISGRYNINCPVPLVASMPGVPAGGIASVNITISKATITKKKVVKKHGKKRVIKTVTPYLLAPKTCPANHVWLANGVFTFWSADLSGAGLAVPVQGSATCTK